MQGYMNRILNVDLSSGKTEVETISEDVYRKFIGGSGLGTKMLWDRKAYDADPLAADNVLIFMTGPFANTPALTSGRHEILAKSPLTGIFGESDSGGTFGPALKRAGYDGVVITGKSDGPVYLWVSEEGVEIRGCATTCRVFGDAVAAKDADWAEEYLDRILLSRHDLNRKLGIPGVFEGANACLQLGFCRRKACITNQLRRHTIPLFRLDEHQVSAMIHEVLGVRRLETLGYFDVAMDRL